MWFYIMYNYVQFNSAFFSERSDFMDLYQTNAIMPKHPDHRKTQKVRDHTSNLGEKKQDNRSSGSWRENEAVNMEEGLIGAFTPEVQLIIDTLRDEIEPLRSKLSAAELRADEFKELAARHAFLNLPNRREMIRKINHVISHKVEFSMPPILILLHVANADQVRCEFGRQFLDHYLTEICERLSQSIRETDIFGSICGNDFSLLMLGGDYALAEREANKLIAEVCDQPVFLNSKSVTIQFLTGIVDLRCVSNGDAAIALADQNMA